MRRPIPPEPDAPTAFGVLFEDDVVLAIDKPAGLAMHATARYHRVTLTWLLRAQRPGEPIAIAHRLDRETSGIVLCGKTTAAATALKGAFARRAVAKRYLAVVEGDLRGEGVIDRPLALARESPIRVKMDPGYQPGAAFYSALTRGVPTDKAFRPAQRGLELQRTFLNRAGAALDLGSVRQGDLIVVKTQVRSPSGRVDNIVVQNLLPSGLEVENPRLKSAETLPWITDADLDPSFLDMRDDRVLLFTDLPDDKWRTSYALLRAVTPGTFRLPPVQAEAMYDASLRATGERGTIEVKVRP
jgi:hypothetical protein